MKKPLLLVLPGFIFTNSLRADVITLNNIDP